MPTDEEIKVAAEVIRDHEDPGWPVSDADDLVQRCKEAVEWQHTGLLRDGALRKLAETMPATEKWMQLRMAESKTADQAMRFVIEHGQ
jgi:hypothetical protein